MAAFKRNELSFEKKIEVINYMTKEGGTLRKISKLFNISKTTASNLNKQKYKILNEWKNSNFVKDRKRLFKNSKYQDVNDDMYNYYKDCRLMGIKVTGPMLQEKAREIAKNYGHENFQASAGWLCSFTKRHGIKFRLVNDDPTDIKEANKNSEFDDLIDDLINAAEENKDTVQDDKKNSMEQDDEYKGEEVMPVKVLLENDNNDDEIKMNVNESKENDDDDDDNKMMVEDNREMCSTSSSSLSHQQALIRVNELISYAIHNSNFNMVEQLLPIFNSVKEEIKKETGDLKSKNLKKQERKSFNSKGETYN